MGAEIQLFANLSQYGSFTTLYSNASGSGNGTNWSGDLSGVYQAAQALCMDIRTSTFRNNTVLTKNILFDLNCNNCCTILHLIRSATPEDTTAPHILTSFALHTATLPCMHTCCLYFLACTDLYLSVTLTLSSLTRLVLFTLHMQLLKSPEDPAHVVCSCLDW